MSSLLRNTWLPAGFALLFGLSLRIFFAVATPVSGDSIPGNLSSYNDEIAHANYSDFLLNNRALPAQIESIDNSGALQRGSYENYQPPLYYIIHSFIVSIFCRDDFNSIVFSGRFLSLLLGILLVPVFFLIAKEASLSAIQISAGVIFLSLSGVLVRFQSTCTNDSLFWLLVGLIYWSVLRLRHSDSPGNWIMFTLLSAAALYTKLSALLLLPLPLLSIFLKREYRRVSFFGISLFLFCLLTLPVWFRNVGEFGGLLPLHAGFGEVSWRLPDSQTILYSFRSLIFPWSEFWQGFFGLVLISVPLATAGVFYLKRRAERSGGFNCFHFGFLIALAAFVWLNLQYDQAESRYLFAAWPAIVWFVSKPARSIFTLWTLFGALLVPFLLFII